MASSVVSRVGKRKISSCVNVSKIKNNFVNVKSLRRRPNSRLSVFSIRSLSSYAMSTKLQGVS
jgi:hypothetical protein